MSIGHHGPMYDALSNIGDPVLLDNDPARTSVVSCIVSSSVAVAAR
jgi:hypothetical protein